MFSATMTKAYFEARLENDYKNEAFKITSEYFEDNVGMGEMYMDIIESRGSWYVINTDIMTIQSCEEFADSLLEAFGQPQIQEWFADYYEAHKEEIHKYLAKATK